MVTITGMVRATEMDVETCIWDITNGLLFESECRFVCCYFLSITGRLSQCEL